MSGLREVWSYRELIYSLVRRDLKARYRNSLLGVAWSWLNPLLMMAVFTVVLNLGSGLPHLPLFVLCAILPWNFFASALSRATASIVDNGHLLKKVYFARQVLPISAVLAALVNFAIGLPLLLGLALLSGAPLTPWALLLPLPVAVQTAFVLGCGMLLATVNLFFRDTQLILDVLLLAWFFASPVFYPFAQVPQQADLLGLSFNPQSLLHLLNPMVAILNSYRDLLYWGRPPGLDLLYGAAVALLTLGGGWLVMNRYSYRFGEEV